MEERKHLFTMDMVATLGDTNAMYNVYFAEYAYWFGKIREIFGMKFLPDLMQGIGKDHLLETKDLSLKFGKSFFCGDLVRIYLYVQDIGRTYFDFSADFTKAVTGDVHASGTMRIVFTDIQGNIKRLPQYVRDFFLG